MSRKKTKQLIYGHKFQRCPICGRTAFDYTYYTEECYGVIEQHGYCDVCGYRVEQAYCEPMDWFSDRKKGHKAPHGYLPKNARRHRRIRRKLEPVNIPVNPSWLKYL